MQRGEIILYDSNNNGVSNIIFMQVGQDTSTSTPGFSFTETHH